MAESHGAAGSSLGKPETRPRYGSHRYDEGTNQVRLAFIIRANKHSLFANLNLVGLLDAAILRNSE